MSVVVTYNEFIHETLNFVNEYTHTYTYIHIRKLIKCSFGKVHFTYNVQDALSNLRKA